MNKKKIKTITAIFALSIAAFGTVLATTSNPNGNSHILKVDAAGINVTFTGGTDTGSNGSSGNSDSITKGVITISGTNLATTTAQYRVYSGCSLTIQTSVGNITGIEFTSTANKGSSNGPDLISTKTGTYTTTTGSKIGTWEGSASSIVFSASAQARFSKIVVTYDVGQSVTSVSDVTGTMPTSYTTLQNWNSENLSATVTTDDASPYQGTTTYSFTPASPALIGETTEGSVSVTASAGGKTSANATVFSNLTISQANVSQALDAIPTDGTYLQNVSVKGTISYLGNYSNGNYTYYISDTGTRTNELQIYNGKYLNGANFTSSSQLNVGDDVIVYGSLFYYNNTTYEFAAGSSILSYVSKVPSVSIDGGNQNIDISDQNITLTATTANIGENTVVWSSSDTSVAQIGQTTGLIVPVGAGSTTITASVTVDEVVYSDTITLTVTAPVISVGETVAFFNGDNYLTNLTGTIGQAGDEEDALVFTVEAGSVQDSFAFNCDGQYLAYDKESGGNSLHVTNQVDDSSSWKLEGTSKTAITSITNVKTSSRILRYNSGSPRFACYTSGQSDVSLKIKEAPADPTYVTLSTNSLTLDQEASETLTFTTDSKQNAFKWYSSNENIVTVEDGTVTAGTTSGKANVIVYFDSNKNGYYDQADAPQATCAVTVTQPTIDYSSVTYGGKGVKITSANSDTYLADGKKIILTYSNYTYSGFSSYLSTVSNGPNFPLTFSDGNVTIGDGTSQLSFMILEVESTTGGFYLKMKDGKYLGHTSTASSTGNLAQDAQPSKIWTISVDANGAADIYGGNERSYLRVNTGSQNRLKPYTSSTGSKPTLYSFVEYTDEALAYAETFIKGNGNANTCAATIQNWTNLGTTYTTTLSDGAKNLFKTATHGESDTYNDPTEYSIPHAVARYDDALLKHPELRTNEFMGREAAGTLSYSAITEKLERPFGDSSNTPAIIIATSLIGITAFGGSVIIARKRKEE